MGLRRAANFLRKGQRVHSRPFLFPHSMFREGTPVAAAMTFNFEFIAAVFRPASSAANSEGTPVSSSAYSPGDKIHAEVPNESAHANPGARDALFTPSHGHGG